MKNWTKIHHQSVLATYPYRGKAFVKGQGAYLFDQAGKKYLDLLTNYGVSIFGYGHPQIVAALEKQLGKLTNLHGSFISPLRAEASQKLIGLCGGKTAQVYWSSSGAEAIEAAIKFAVMATGKTHFVAAQGGYHGKTIGALALTHKPKYRQPFNQLLFSTSHVPFGNVAKLAKVITAKTAAVVLEPIQGESGIIIPAKHYLKAVALICRQKNILLIVDEIQTGAGRTGTFLASHAYGIEPDIVCLGKGIAAGIPIGLTLVSQAVADRIPRGTHTATFGGSPLAATGVLTTLKLLDQKQLHKAKTLGRYFLKRLREIKNSQIKAVRGAGLMVAIELWQNSTPVLKALQDRGIIAGPAGDNVIRFLPSYIITKNQIDHTVDVLKKILVAIP